MQPVAHPLVRTFRTLCVALCAAALLTSCGGGGGSSDVPAAASCSVADQKTWLASYSDEWYFWTRVSPKPATAPFASVDALFRALLYTGNSAGFPADRWSYSESSESFNRFFGDGQTLGYGVSVAGLEVTNQPAKPLYVRYIEAQSPAAAAGLQRGDQILALNERTAAEVIAANDFSALTASSDGQALTLLVRSGGVDRRVVLLARVFSLSPVPLDSVVTSAAGRKLGYIVVKDMVSQVTAPLDAAFARFRAAGVQNVVLDLRYNGGGLVSVAGTVGSYLGGDIASGRVFASLLYNDRRAGSNNAAYRFSNPGAALGAARVYVLTGARTCSASEQVINGLRGAGIDVVAIGDTTCGKPVGFLPSAQCGTTYSMVNFESVNDRNEGRYFNGFAATCPVAEDFSRALGSGSEPLLAAALRYADSGSCPALAAGRAHALAASRALADGVRTPLAQDGGERFGMVAR